MYDIAIWTPINPESGFGHFYRMFGLYEKLLEEKQSVTYFTNSDFIKLEKIDILHIKTDSINKIIEFLQKKLVKMIIIDNYDVSQNEIKELNKYFKIVYFDYKFLNPTVDAIVNFNPYAPEKYKNKNEQTRYFLGLENMLFRKEIKAEKSIDIKKKNIFISIGGSDVGHITYKILPFLPSAMHYNIVLGNGCSKEYYEEVDIRLKQLYLNYCLYRQPKNYFEILRSSEFVIISCSTTAYEVIYFSKPFVCINVVENQDELTNYLNSKNITTLTKDNLEDITDIINKNRFKILEESWFSSQNNLLYDYIKEGAR
ncbi:hypothetical protein FCU45_01200 [Sulfurimonas crateris]|uniref:Glycosyl transferase family 28 C-terminal domain-containing protein n=1 Tax=Sulfurimonas crateris TaxID=2574727 RepID=A0A4U2ZA43_9BACT|nr:hypothetical protein [Sulfurimonas crateris]TKI71034.1 hypothetical protein FCU45_01200 [Sulfurimonas crateris]